MGKLLFPELNTAGNENNTACGLIDPNYQLKMTAERKSSAPKNSKKLLGSLVVSVFRHNIWSSFLVKNHSLKQKEIDSETHLTG